MSLLVEDLVIERDGCALFAPASFQVKPGELLHLRGDNGIGKTTLLKALLGLWPVAKGKITWRSGPRYKIGLSDWGYIGHDCPLLAEMTVGEHLSYLARLAHKPQRLVTVLLETLRLTPYQTAYTHELSQGQRKQLCLAPVYADFHQHWLLDEPFTDLDKHNQSRLTDKLCQTALQRQGVVVLTSHLLEHDFGDCPMRIVDLQHP